MNAMDGAERKQLIDEIIELEIITFFHINFIVSLLHYTSDNLR